MSSQHLFYRLSSNLHNKPERQAGSICILTDEENKTQILICPSFMASKRQSWDLNPSLSDSKAHVFSTIPTMLYCIISQEILGLNLCILRIRMKTEHSLIFKHCQQNITPSAKTFQIHTVTIHSYIPNICYNKIVDIENQSTKSIY